MVSWFLKVPVVEKSQVICNLQDWLYIFSLVLLNVLKAVGHVLFVFSPECNNQHVVNTTKLMEHVLFHLNQCFLVSMCFSLHKKCNTRVTLGILAQFHFFCSSHALISLPGYYFVYIYLIHVTYLYFHSEVFVPVGLTVLSDPMLDYLQTVE
jgi:hypothetical protein